MTKLALQADGGYILDALASGGWLEVPIIRYTWTSSGGVNKVGSVIRNANDDGKFTASGLAFNILTDNGWIELTRASASHERYDITEAGRERLAKYLAHPSVKAAKLRQWQRAKDLHQRMPDLYEDPGPQPADTWKVVQHEDEEA